MDNLVSDFSLNSSQFDNFKESEEKYHILFRNSPIGFFYFNSDGIITACNKSCRKIMGEGNGDIVGSQKGITRALAGEEFSIIVNINDIILEIYYSPIKNNKEEVIGGIGITNDITQRYRYEEKLKYLATHDTLTGLYNRIYFEKQVESVFQNSEKNVGIFLIDVDGLKYINDSLGHQKGDQLLVSLSIILKETFTSNEIVARIGDDEFVVVVTSFNQSYSKNITSTLNKRIDNYNKGLKGDENPISISIGFAMKKSDNVTLEQVFKEAEDNVFKEKLPKRDGARISILNAIKAAMFEKDRLTEEHMERIKKIASNFADAAFLSEHNKKLLELTTELHDIGKIKVPDRILNKNGKLTEQEFNIIKNHSAAGFRILKATPELSNLAEFVLSSHERWDGKGYPKGLAGEDIPLISRMSLIIDAYDAMTNNRPYRKGVSKEEAIEELKRNAGKQFDPGLVPIFIKILLEPEK